MYRTLTLPLKKLMVTRSLRAEDGGALQPDGLIARLEELFPELKEQGGIAGRIEHRTRDAAGGAGRPGRVAAGSEGRRGRRRARRVEDGADPAAAQRQYGESGKRMLAELLPEEEGTEDWRGNRTGGSS